MITRRAALLAMAGLVSGIWVGGSFIAVPQARAQATKTEIKRKAKKDAQEAKEKRQSMTPEEQQEAKEKAKAAAKEEQEKWQSMTPEEKQRATEQGKAAAKKTRKKWESLPQ